MKIEDSLFPHKIRLREDLNLSDEFRAEYNAWLLEWFGWQEGVLVTNGIKNTVITEGENRVFSFGA